MYTYPVVNRDDPGHVLGLLGSLWRLYYGGNNALLATVQGNLMLTAQQKQNMNEAAACLSKVAVPLLHKELWVPLEISGDCSPKLPGLVGLPLIVNRITDPTLLLMEGIDYTVVDGMVVFPNERLDDPLVPRDGDTAYLWGFNAQVDREYLARHFGYWLGISVQSCQRDKTIVNAIIDCIVGGTTVAELERLLAAVLAVPVAKGEETVILDAVDRRGRFLATERNVYRIAPDAIVGAPVGSELHPGQPLVRAFELTELRHLPPETVVTLPEGMASDYASNTVKAGEVNTDSCIAVQLADMARMPGVLTYLRQVVPPQTGIVFAKLEQ